MVACGPACVVQVLRRCWGQLLVTVLVSSPRGDRSEQAAVCSLLQRTLAHRRSEDPFPPELGLIQRSRGGGCWAPPGLQRGGWLSGPGDVA